MIGFRILIRDHLHSITLITDSFNYNKEKKSFRDSEQNHNKKPNTFLFCILVTSQKKGKLFFLSVLKRKNSVSKPNHLCSSLFCQRKEHHQSTTQRYKPNLLKPLNSSPIPPSPHPIQYKKITQS